MVQPVGVDAEGALWVKESSSKPDWNQNDPNADDYIKNRTHWEEEGESGVVVHKIDPKFIELPENLATTDDVQEVMDLAQTTANEKMSATNPVGIGSFSMNRQANSEIGEFSAAIGESTIANANHSFARGKFNAQIPVEIVEEWIQEQKTGLQTTTILYESNSYSFDEETGYFHLTGTISQYNVQSIALGSSSKYYMINTTNGTEIAKSYGAVVRSKRDRATGLYTIDGLEWLKRSIKAKYVEVVGNGTSDTERSNIHTLDWDGNAWFAGDVYIGSESGINMDDGSKKLATEEYVNKALSGGNVDFQTDETLTLKNGILSVNTTNDMEQDNTLPITSAGVFATVGNIEALLKTI